MRRWLLWEVRNSEGELKSHTFFPSENEWAMEEVKREGAVLVWEVEAEGSNAANRAKNEYLGWEEYQPMLRDDGTPYPEDERDDM